MGRSPIPLAIFVFALLVIPVALTSCGKADQPPTGASELVIRVETGGGFIPVEYSLTQTPDFSLYGDGTVIVTGPMIEIWPQPALPNLQKTTVSQETIAGLLAAARDAGLFDTGVDYGIPSVADAPTTTITINANDKTYVSEIYALGFGQTIDTESGLSPSDLDLTSGQAEARERVLAFTSKTGDLDAFTSDTLQWEQYEFASLAVFSLPYDPDAPMYDDSVEPNHLDWPLGDLSTLGEAAPPAGYRRAVVTGEDLDQLRPLISLATRITLWKSGEREYYLYFRPLLPDENA